MRDNIWEFGGNSGLRRIASFGPERRQSIPGAPWFQMRINDDLRKTVVFFGFEGPKDQGSFTPIGTGFLLDYDDSGYLITAKHLAQALGNDPFFLRINKKDGEAYNIPVDGAEWAEHPRSDVDVAAVPLNFGGRGILDVLYLPHAKLLTAPELKRNRIGTGDVTYTVGLFRFVHGRRRNLPIVHVGNIAMMPEDELIPVQDWNFPYEKSKRAHIEGYLIETQGMQGLSGAPVFVRATVSFRGEDTDPDSEQRQRTVLAARHEVMLLGLWQGSWDAPPDEVVAVQSGKEVRVPVGLGVVVPADKIEETLQLQGLRAMREERKKKFEMAAAQGAASSDSVLPLARSSVSPGPAARDEITDRRGQA
jgi:hypothetical protein